MINQLFFSNYESNKIILQNIEIVNCSILIILILVTLITVKKQPLNYFDKIETDQMKGIAILFVILGHFWVHVSQNTPSVVLSGDAVTIFFNFIRLWSHKVCKRTDVPCRKISVKKNQKGHGSLLACHYLNNPIGLYFSK